jgi:hypothetical protein
VLVLLLTVCSLSAPADCRQVPLPFADMTPMQCMMAQPTIAQWADEHPGDLRHRGWRCAFHDGDDL